MQTESRLRDLYLLSLPSTNPQEPPLPNTTPPSPENQKTITHLQSLSLAHISAINTRSLHATHPAWTTLSPNFMGDVRAVCMKSPRRLDRNSYLAEYRWLTTIRPEYHLEVKGISTELKARGKGAVTLNLENTGNPVGVVRVIVVIVEWRRDGGDGEWECVEVRAARGPEV
ncbi:hypothetical protein M409DRAFT_26767 [Zasmidium cellare ATCC 36951]|uniref:DUF4440 domain-containing protein n=1 Tax=Zasmidium cellare ATCC 36951 TaxID=1080233 RepID=A0A6A6C794_ZASCE|nr:uncharacterized protein M409DRAFT_26767 [Zasmidium cellare ATCC 36951]KAF2162915.1 hypothetical protein M409DRAFT_26767 [Zasmidium cellare ATCC 36951]